MILKKVEENDSVKAIYSSTNICASIYNTKTSSLTIIFSNGGQYIYEGVSKTDYMRFEIADSQGSVMNTHIKKYKTTKLSPIDTTVILAEVKDLSTLQSKITPEVAVKKLISDMLNIVSTYVKNVNITKGSIEELRKSISDYEETVKS